MGKQAILALVACFGLALSAVAHAAETTPAAAATPVLEIDGFDDEAFLSAAFNNCATVENRSAKSCNCERKLIGSRVEADDKKMAYLYWTNKDRFVTEFEKRKQADAKFERAFSERFSNLQALVIAACGT